MVGTKENREAGGKQRSAHIGRQRAGPGFYLGTYKKGWGNSCETVYETQTPEKFTKYQAQILQLLEEVLYSR